jgi:hypothetical protein
MRPGDPGWKGRGRSNETLCEKTVMVVVRVQEEMKWDLMIKFTEGTLTWKKKCPTTNFVMLATYTNNFTINNIHPSSYQKWS